MEIHIMPELLTAPTVAIAVQAEYVPPAEQIICIHPHAELVEHIYYLVAQCRCNHDKNARYEALVLVANPCLAAINKAVRLVLGNGWYVTQYRIA
jgi:hypothetical protein